MTATLEAPVERQLHLADDVDLPLDTVTETIGVLARKGSGKTYLGAVFVEELLKAQQQVVVIDPVGVWWGLRSSADGAGPGLPILIAGGEHQDVPLESSSGAALADFVVDERQSVILDLADMSAAEMVEFVGDFAAALYLRKARQKTPMQLILDEADMFAPQVPQRGERAMLGEIDKIVRRGRSRGIGVMMITQRPAALAKNVLTQIGLLIVLRLTSPQDQKAIDAWVSLYGSPEERSTLMSSLAILPVGRAWFVAPGQLFTQAQVRRRETFDSSATPKAGEHVAEPRTLADVDLQVLQKRLAGSIERSLAENPVALRRRIEQLEGELAQRQTVEIKAEPTPINIEALLAAQPPPPPIAPELQAHLNELLNEVQAGVGKLQQAIAGAANAAVASAQQPADATVKEAPKVSRHVVSRPEIVPGVEEVKPRTPHKLKADAPATSGPTSPLALAQLLADWFPYMPTKEELAKRFGREPNVVGFIAPFASAKQKGLLVEHDNAIEITPGGFAALGQRQPNMLNREVALELWAKVLTQREMSGVNELLARHPKAITRAAFAKALGMSAEGGGFGKIIARLKRNGLLSYSGQQIIAGVRLVKLSDA